MLAADELEPLVLADGTRIDPTTGKAEKQKRQRFVEVPSNSEAQQLVVKTRKTVAELPMPPAQLSGVALVAFYTLFGLPDAQIAVALDGRLTVEQIAQIKSLEAYTSFMATAKENIIATSVDAVRDKFQKHAVNAADRIVELADSDNDVLAFKASQDILDRAGHRPADIVEHKHKMEGGLQIIVTHKRDDVSVPVLDLQPEEVRYADRD